MQWFNSLPTKYKNEVLRKLVEEKIELEANRNYRVIVDINSKNKSFSPQRSSVSPKRGPAKEAGNYTVTV